MSMFKFPKTRPTLPTFGKTEPRLPVVTPAGKPKPVSPANPIGTPPPSTNTGGPSSGTSGAVSTPSGNVILKGGDFSHFDPETEWTQYNTTGHWFAAAKMNDGAGGADSKGQSQRAGAHSVGLPFIGYHFFRFGANARAQARDFYKAFGPLQKAEGWAADYEWDNLSGIARYANGGQTDAAGNDQFMTFIEECEQLFGLGGIIYTGRSFMPMKDARFSSRKLWVFDWHTTNRKEPTAKDKPILPPSWDAYTLWQYTDREETVGAGKVDMNVFRGTPSDLLAICKQ